MCDLFLFNNFWSFHCIWIFAGYSGNSLCTTIKLLQISLRCKNGSLTGINFENYQLALTFTETMYKIIYNFYTSNSNLVYLISSIQYAMTDSLVCVDFVPWKNLNLYFLKSIRKSLLLAMLGFLSVPLFPQFE